MKKLYVCEENVSSEKKYELNQEKSKTLTGKASIDKPWLSRFKESATKASLPKMTIYDFLYQNNEKFCNRKALNYFGRKISYFDLFQRIDQTAKALKYSGVKEGDIVTISMPTTPEVVYLFYALSRIGAIANMIDPRTSAEGIKDYINEVGSSHLFLIDSAYGKIANILDQTDVSHLVTISPADSLPVGLNYGYHAKEWIEKIRKNSPLLKQPTGKEDLTIQKWNTFYKQGKDYFGVVDASYQENRPVAIVHTGGTTGVPKGVLLSNDNLNAGAFQCMISGLDFQRHHKWYDIMPPFIVYGVGNGLHLPLVVGMEVILEPQFNPKKFDQALLKHKPNHLAGVPSHWENVIHSKKLENKDLSFIISPIVGGDSMNTKLEEAANEFLAEHNSDAKIIKGYGMSEVNAAVCVCANKESNPLGSVGIPFTHTVMSVFEENTDHELNYGEIGEICMTGPNTMLGYYHNQKATDEVLKMHHDGNKWIHSGDLGYMSEEGFIYIVDRLKRMIVRHDGFKVFPSLIESTISLSEKVKQVEVVGIPDSLHTQGRLPKAHIVLKEPYQGQEEQALCEIRNLCEEKLPEYVQPAAYQFRDSLPLTPIGKVDFIALEKEDLQTEKGHIKIKK